MKKAVILHGICSKSEYCDLDFPSPSNAHWLAWLQQKFLRSGILCQNLEMPKVYDPNYDDWKECFSQLNLGDDSVIVGHSAGCGFILKYLHEFKNVKIDKLYLVAPWLDPKRSFNDFMEFTFEENLQDRINEIHILFSTDEKVGGILESKNKILEIYPKSIYHEFKDKGHFCIGNMGYRQEFTELWDIIDK